MKWTLLVRSGSVILVGLAWLVTSCGLSEEPSFTEETSVRRLSLTVDGDAVEEEGAGLEEGEGATALGEDSDPDTISSIFDAIDGSAGSADSTDGDSSGNNSGQTSSSEKDFEGADFSCQ